VASGAGFASVSQSVLAQPFNAPWCRSTRCPDVDDVSIALICRPRPACGLPMRRLGTWVEAGAGHIGCRLGAPYL